MDYEIFLNLFEACVAIEGRALSFFRSYLTQCTQCVSVDNVTSELVNLVYGVPQGSVLGPLKFCLYTLPLGAIIRYHGLNFHMYADDTQLYIAFGHSDPVSYLNQLNACILDIRSWMITNKLKINDDKTEFLVITSPYVKLPSPDFQLNVGSCTIDTSSSACNLGVLFDSHMNLEGHITNVCRSLHLHLRNIRSIRKFLTDDATACIVHSLISSKLDYCNSLLYGLPDSKLQRLQRMQNLAARIVSRTPKYDHISPVLKALHWLPVKARILFKILLLMYKSVNGIAPPYLCDMAITCEPSRSLRSAQQCLLFIPKAKCITLGERAFSVAGPREWNKLPLGIRQADTVAIFKVKLKTYLFSLLY